MANSWHDKALKKQKKGKGFKAFKHTHTKKGQKVTAYFTVSKDREIKEKRKTLPFFSQ